MSFRGTGEPRKQGESEPHDALIGRRWGVQRVGYDLAAKQQQQKKMGDGLLITRDSVP